MRRHHLIFFFILTFHVNSFAQKLYTLPQAMQEASNNNIFLKTESYNIGISKADITTAALRPNPVLNNQYLQLMNLNYSPSGSSDYLSRTNRQTWFQLTKPILLGNLREKRMDVARQNFELAKYSYNGTVRNLYYDVANKWLDIWLLKNNLMIFEDAKDNIDTLVQINENRYKNSVITSTELLRTKLLSDQYTLQLKTLKQQYRNEMQVLKLLTGSGDSIDINTTDEIVKIRIPDKIDSLITIALEKRTVQSKALLELSKRNISLQRAASLPYFEGGVLLNPQNSIIYAGTYATLSIPVFNRNQGEIEKSKVYVQQAETRISGMEFQIKTEVYNAFNSFQTNKQNLEEFKYITQQSLKVLSTVRYSYLKGNTTIIDFIEAQRSYLDTRKLYYEAAFNLGKSYIELIYTTGIISEINN